MGENISAWPVSRAAEAVQQLAVASGLSQDWRPRATAIANSHETVEANLEQMAATAPFDVRGGDVSYRDLERTLQTSAPALFRVRSDTGDALIAVQHSSRRTLRLLTPAGARRVPIKTVVGWLARHIEAPELPRINQLLESAGIEANARDTARGALLRTRLADATATRCWALCPSATATLKQHLQHAQLPRRLALFLIAYAAAAGANLAAWWLIGAAALGGRFDPGTLLAWSFLLLGLVPVSLFGRWSQGIFILGISGIVKQRLFAGALKLDPDEVRHDGVGHHLGRVLQSESIEALTIAAGFYAVAGSIELLLAFAVFAIVEAYALLIALTVAVAPLAIVGVVYFRHRERWAVARIRLTHDLIERMVGHRTRLIQDGGRARHEQEDQALKHYATVSRHMDRAAVVLSAVPRLWLLIAIVGLAPQWVSASRGVGIMAASVGAVLLALGALRKLEASLAALSDAGIAWRQLRVLFTAANKPEPRGRVALGRPTREGRRSGALITGQDLQFRFPERAQPVLRDCNFRIARGDRIRLSGPSAAGKSTLVSLLTGLRAPDHGLLLLDGLDRATLGASEWRRRVAAAPQFHDNHVFNDTLAFNLLMGRRWPPTAEDLHLAHTVCRRLELGPLLDRMPNGLFQVVGESGWQLSHGERSRVFIARALLQGADLVILDESFGELDPESLQRCLPAAASFAHTVVVVAHA